MLTGGSSYRFLKNCELNEDRVFREPENLINKTESNRSEPSVIVEYYNSNENIPDPSELQNNKKYIVIFDDCITVKNQDIMKLCFTRGRHKNVIVFYLSQSYFSLDRRERYGTRLGPAHSPDYSGEASRSQSKLSHLSRRRNGDPTSCSTGHSFEQIGVAERRHGNNCGAAEIINNIIFLFF